MRTDYEILIEYALKLLSGKRYTENEILKKLRAKKIGAGDDILNVIARLKEYKYINDNDYAKDFINNRAKFAPRGKRLIALELRKKGICKEIIKHELSSGGLNELELALEVLKRKKSTLKKLTGQKKKEKIFLILASKGFDFDTIYKAVAQC
ncbi:regulatory protein RecX [Candidatus Peregrinibacteria bacterium]|nr:regulatory protein RecX [Candidatus Peregrinibacteria bacterium]